MGTGFFLLRNSLYDNGEYPSEDCVVHFSPDIIVSGGELSYSAATADYYRQKGGGKLNHGIRNNIYVLAKNNTGKAQNGWARAFIAPFASLYGKAAWTPLYVRTYDSKNETGSAESENSTSVDSRTEVMLYQDQQVQAQPEAIVLSMEPFQIYRVETLDCFYAVFAQTRTAAEEWEELPEGWPDDTALWNYLRTHPRVALTGFWASY